jgi:hypothetical protein
MLKVPAGALKKPVLITMEVPSDTLNYVVFSPEGLTFDAEHPPSLTMSYRNCRVADKDKDAVSIVYTDDSLSAVLETTEWVGNDKANQTVDAKIKHFSTYVLDLLSRYAVAY